MVNPWPPAVGPRLLIEDLLLRFTVRQQVLEVHQTEEAGYDGFGPLFTARPTALRGVGLSCPHRMERISTGSFCPHNV